jgi:hypothetical protein
MCACGASLFVCAWAWLGLLFFVCVGVDSGPLFVLFLVGFARELEESGASIFFKYFLLPTLYTHSLLFFPLFVFLIFLLVFKSFFVKNP